MKPFWEKVEHYNAKLIPLAIVALLGVIIIELFIHIEDPTGKLLIFIVDNIILGIFIIDLVFLGIHSKNVRFFFRHYWLDLLAVIPLALIFTLTQRVYRLVFETERIVIGQAVLHESLEARKGLKGLSAGEKMAKYVRIGTRGLRVVAKSRFFTHLLQRNERVRIHPQKRKKMVKWNKRKRM